ncbi:MAG: haloacid dehalogenase-like hydrolase [Deltaproteobacteria bacterium]|nr:haloacid dehalogenase-like hydrolase [Deltaproteobacteria bacterium]
MKQGKSRWLVAAWFGIFMTLAPIAAPCGIDPLPSWNDGPNKKAIIQFAERAEKEIPIGERVAVFDNDGTLWSEQPIYFQFAFALDRIKSLAKDHPEWNNQEPFKSVLSGDIKALMATGEKGVLEVVAASHSGMTTDQFSQILKEWLKTARHPVFKVPYTDLVFQPMLELLAYLRGKGFKTFIVSGGGVEFMRGFAEKSYGVPPEQVIGSSGKLEFEMKDGKPFIEKLPTVDFIDDKAGKPVGIQKFIGRRPVAAFGNSDGDLQMLQWTTVDHGSGPRIGLIVHHDDAAREFAYDRDSPIGTLNKAWDEAGSRGWLVVSMKQDWKKIYPKVHKP